MSIEYDEVSYYLEETGTNIWATQFRDVAEQCTELGCDEDFENSYEFPFCGIRDQLEVVELGVK